MPSPKSLAVAAAHVSPSELPVRLPTLGVALGYFFYFGAMGILMPYLSPVLLALGYSREEIGLLQSMAAVCFTVVPVIGGRIGDRYLPADTLLRICGAIAVTGCALLWWQSDAPAWLFVPLFLLWAIGRAPLVPLQDTLAMHVVCGSARAYARLRVMGSLGFVAAAVVSGWLFEQRLLALFFPALVLAFGAFWLATFFLPRQVSMPAAKADAEPTRFWSGLGITWWVWLAAMTLHWIGFGPYHYGLTLFLQELRMPPEATGAVWGLGVGVEIVVFVAGSRLFERLSYRPILFIALGSSLCRWLLLGAFPHPWTVWLTQPLHGPGFALFYAAAMQALNRFSRGRNLASYQGLFSTVVMGIGSAVGLAIAGFLHERMAFHQVLMWMCVPQTLALLLLWRCPLVPVSAQAGQVGQVGD